MVPVVLDRELYEQARRAAEAEGLSFSALVRRLLAEAVGSDATPAKAQAAGADDPAPAAAGRRRRGLEELEDCAVIAGVRRPEALRRRCAELGLRLCELDEVGVEGVAVVCAEPWLQYVSYLAEEEPERLPKGSKALEDRFAEILRKARRGGELSEEEKAVAALWVLWREGEVFWDGARWRKPPKVEARRPEVEPPPEPRSEPSGG